MRFLNRNACVEVGLSSAAATASAAAVCPARNWNLAGLAVRKRKVTLEARTI
jgi:hypothetical protein